MHQVLVYLLQLVPTMELEAQLPTPIMEVHRKISAQADIEFETLSNSAPLSTDHEAPISYLGKALARNNLLGRVSFATDAGWLNHAGIPCVVIGPGDIAVAHKPNEFIEISQLEECLGFMDRLRERMTQEVLLA